MPAVRSWFWFLEQAAAGSRMTTEAEQEQLVAQVLNVSVASL